MNHAANVAVAADVDGAVAEPMKVRQVRPMRPMAMMKVPMTPKAPPNKLLVNRIPTVPRRQPRCRELKARPWPSKLQNKLNDRVVSPVKHANPASLVNPVPRVRTNLPARLYPLPPPW